MPVASEIFPAAAALIPVVAGRAAVVDISAIAVSLQILLQPAEAADVPPASGRPSAVVCITSLLASLLLLAGLHRLFASLLLLVGLQRLFASLPCLHPSYFWQACSGCLHPFATCIPPPSGRPAGVVYTAWIPPPSGGHAAVVCIPSLLVSLILLVCLQRLFASLCSLYPSPFWRACSGCLHCLDPSFFCRACTGCLHLGMAKLR